jgi:hypothetical protein
VFVFIYPYIRTKVKECKENRHALNVSLSSALLMFNVAQTEIDDFN